MKRFSCACGQAVFFHNRGCTHCGARLGFDPRRLDLLTLTAPGDGTWTDGQASYRDCRNALEHANCNWLVHADDPDDYCVSCRLNRTIPNLSSAPSREYWDKIEVAKRRLIYSLLDLGLPVLGQTRGWPHGLAFDLVEDQRSNPTVSEEHVPIHHAGGIITINVAEADDVIRAMTRKQMNERYRTLLGHFRHESAHYYFDRLVYEPATLDSCRALFGDERADYEATLADYYAQGPAPDWTERHISAYASAHPAEDWAETWAHYLHLRDCLETAAAYRLVPLESGGFDDLLDTWLAFSVAFNELNRSMGLADAYPFVIPPPVADKLRFVHDLLAAGGIQ